MIDEPDNSAIGTERIQETSLRLFIESVVDYAIFLLDPDGYVVTWNPGAQRIKGYAADEIIGKHFSNFYTKYDRDRKHPEEELKIARAVGRYEEEGIRVRKDGTTFWANVVITAIRDATGVLLGFGKVTRDLTERKQQEEREKQLAEERTARAEAEAATAAKSAFLTTMSHELRTPLNAIIGYAEIMALEVQGPITPDQQTSLERIRNSSKHLLGLINDVLNISRVESGTIEYNLVPVRAMDILKAVEPLVLPQFESHGVGITVVPCNRAIVVLCDPDRTQQILLNLLTNAYKFTPEGGSVRLTCTTDGEKACFSVTDTGRGIPAEKLAAIFEPFVQIDRHLNPESQQGVGLGLAISRDLARGMNGELRAFSEIDKGSHFDLTLPLFK